MEFVKTRQEKDKCIDYPINFFVIPFSFDINGFSFIKDKLLEGKWIEKNGLNRNEFFPHIRQLIEGDLEELICERFSKDTKGISLVEKKTDTYNGTINNIELYLFKTGVGFYKYSLCYDRAIDVDGLIATNNRVKSIAHDYHDVIIEKNIAVDFVDAMLDTYDDHENQVEAIDVTDKNAIIKLNSASLPDAVIDKEIKITYGKEKKKYIRFTQRRKMDIRDFLNLELSNIVSITYFNKFLYEKKSKQMASKANVFVVGLLKTRDVDFDAVGNKAFLLSRGYKDSYKKSSAIKVKKDIFSTFDNSLWSVSREGVANLVMQVGDHETDTFFTSTYFDRIDNYFFLYILALHQYYSLIKAAEDISRLPYSFDDYAESNDNYKRLMKMYDEINYIYLRCIYHEVTHISHQAAFYNQLFDMLGIESLLNEINFEMDRLTSIVSQIRDNKRRESYQLHEASYRTRQEQRIQDELRRELEAEKKSDREKRYAIIGSIFAFFTVFEALWNIAILADLKHLVNLGISDQLLYISFIVMLLVIGLIIGSVVFLFWNKKNK